MNIRFKRYKKDYDYSYANGVYSSIELLKTRPEQVLKVIISISSEKNEGIARIKNLCANHDIPVEVNDKIINRISMAGNHLAITVFRKYNAPIDPFENHVVLVNPSDMGNLGTIARTMAGFGITNLALIRPAVDVFDPKAVRASMGSIFRLSMEYFPDFKDYMKRHKNRPYLFMTGTSKPLESVRFKTPFALVFGNESSGLSEDIYEGGERVTIPHSRSIDSLNLAVAAGIVIYECSRRGHLSEISIE